MKKTRTAFTIVLTLLTLTISSQPAMSRNHDNILPGVILGAAVGALIVSQVGYYPNQQYMQSPRPQFYARPVLMVPAPVFRPRRPVVYVPQPRHYRKHHRHHRQYRKHWKHNEGRARW